MLHSLKNGYLDLSDFQISDEISCNILPLLSILNVTSLDLKSNDIGSDGATALAKTLETNTSITELYLENNQIGPNVATALAKALTKNTSLKELDLCSNNLERYRSHSNRRCTKNQHITDNTLP